MDIQIGKQTDDEFSLPFMHFTLGQPPLDVGSYHIKVLVEIFNVQFVLSFMKNGFLDEENPLMLGKPA
ncbi:MAG: hypothetical protein ACJ749_14550 [Flavisolibacter sp.]